MKKHRINEVKSSETIKEAWLLGQTYNYTRIRLVIIPLKVAILKISAFSKGQIDFKPSCLTKKL